MFTLTETRRISLPETHAKDSHLRFATEQFSSTEHRAEQQSDTSYIKELESLKRKIKRESRHYNVTWQFLNLQSDWSRQHSGVAHEILSKVTIRIFLHPPPNPLSAWACSIITRKNVWLARHDCTYNARMRLYDIHNACICIMLQC